jgi:hypothetical protein
MTTYSTWGYRYPFVYLPTDMNCINSRLLSGLEAIAGSVIKKQINLAQDQNTGAAAASHLMSGFQELGRLSHYKCPFFC